MTEARMQEKPETKLDCLLHVEIPKWVKSGQGGIASPPWGEVPGIEVAQPKGRGAEDCGPLHIL